MNGSPTQTAMMEFAAWPKPACTGLDGVCGWNSACLTGRCSIFPTCVLGVVVSLVALQFLIDLKGLREIRRESPQEYALAVMTAAVVLPGSGAGDPARDGFVYCVWCAQLPSA